MPFLTRDLCSTNQRPLTLPPSPAIPALFYQTPVLVCAELRFPHATLLDAIESSIQSSGVGIAVSLRATADHKLVVCSSTCPPRFWHPARRLSDISYAELQTFSSPEFDGGIVLLEELLEAFGGTPLFLDLKDPGLELLLAKRLEMFPYANESIVANSWWDSGIATLKRFAGGIACSRSIGKRENLSWLKRTLLREGSERSRPIWMDSSSVILSLRFTDFSLQDLKMFRECGAELLVQCQTTEEMATIKNELSAIPICAEHLLNLKAEYTTLHLS